MPFTLPKIVKFPQPVLQIHPGYDNLLPDEPVKGAILSDLTHCWHAKGPHLEVRDVRTGRKVASWTFGHILNDEETTRIVCIEEMRRPHSRVGFLVVALENETAAGMICLFEVFGSKVIQAVKVPKKITSLHIIDSGLEPNHIPGLLRSFNGIIAVGTEEGDVYLIDISKQLVDEDNLNIEINNELNPSDLLLLSHRDLAHIDRMDWLNGDDRQMAIQLNECSGALPHFSLKGPGGDDRLFVNRAEVQVSALLYCPQLTSLIVGYNFGAFQIWNLKTLKLMYTSPVCDEHIPVTHFALQEPADDPRAFCYIWAAYSYSELDAVSNSLPFIVMYSLSFKSKEFLEGYGCLYNNFQHCSVRFQRELGSFESLSSEINGGYCKGFQVIAKTFFNDCLEEPDSCGDSLSLLTCTWSIFSKSTGKQSTFLLLFDLNQWYKEQMPSSTNWKDCQYYIYKAPLDKVALIYSVKINPKGLRQFTFAQKTDEFFQPSALSFDIFLLRHHDVTAIRNEGVQKAFLLQMEASGSLCLVRPEEFYEEVDRLGLIPLFMEVNACKNISEERELLLSVALEQKLTRWLCRVASDWANGSFTASSGCCLDFLMKWAYQRAIVLKNHCDKIVVPLFDHSLIKLDNNGRNLLNNCTRQLNNIKIFYDYVLSELGGSFLSNVEVIKDQFQMLEAVCMYLEVLQWMMNVGLLPEGHTSNSYPVEQIAEYFHERRAESASFQMHNSKDSLLFIDNLINRKCGAELLQKQWQDDGGTGLYPPPSLQSLLRSYLIPNVDLQYKHSLVLYVFLDLTKVLIDDDLYGNLKMNLIKFPAVFKLSNNLIKVTQAFWMLDHGDYNAAMDHLLDPFVGNNDLESWQHSIVLKTLQIQNQHHLALYYMQVRKPPILNTDDLNTTISLFIVNGMLDEAFRFQKRHGANLEVLYHLFNECRRNGLLKSVIYRQLNNEDEKAFLKYLNDLNQPIADDLLIFYNLLRARFIEAFDVHDKTTTNRLSSHLVKMLKNLMPEVNRQLINFVRSERNLWKEINKPEPLFFTVTDKNNKEIHYKSTIINKALCKARQTFHISQNINNSTINTEEIPFLRTPTAKLKASKVSTPVIQPKMILDDSLVDDTLPSPAKRLKLSFRNDSMQSEILQTPIVLRRKSPIQINEKNITKTPTSILKVKTDSFVDSNLVESPKKRQFSLSPRRSLLSKTPNKYPVRFDEDLPSPDKSDTKESSSEEVFYSPDISGEENPQVIAEEQDLHSNVEESNSNKNEDNQLNDMDNMSKSCRLSDRLRARKPLFRQVLEHNAFENSSFKNLTKVEEKTTEETTTIVTTKKDDVLIEKTIEHNKRESFKYSDVEMNQRVVKRLSYQSGCETDMELSEIPLDNDSYNLTLPSFVKTQKLETEKKDEEESKKDLESNHDKDQNLNFTRNEETVSPYEFSLDNIGSPFKNIRMYIPITPNKELGRENEEENEQNHDRLISGAAADIDDEKTDNILDNSQNQPDPNIWDNIVYDDLSNCSNSKKYELNTNTFEEIQIQEEIQQQQEQNLQVTEESNKNCQGEVIEIESSSSGENTSNSSSSASSKDSNKSTIGSVETISDSSKFDKAYLDLEVSEMNSDECSNVSSCYSWVQKSVSVDEGGNLQQNESNQAKAGQSSSKYEEIIIEEIQNKDSSSNDVDEADKDDENVVMEPLVLSDEDKQTVEDNDDNNEKNNDKEPFTSTRQRGRPKKIFHDTQMEMTDDQKEEIKLNEKPRLRRRSQSQQPIEEIKEESTPSRLRRSSRRLSKNDDNQSNTSNNSFSISEDKTLKIDGPTPYIRKLKRCMSVDKIRTYSTSTVENTKDIFDMNEQKTPAIRKKRSKSVDQINLEDIKKYSRKTIKQVTKATDSPSSSKSSPICKELRINVVKDSMLDESATLASSKKMKRSKLESISEETESQHVGKVLTRQQSNLLKSNINEEQNVSSSEEIKPQSTKSRLRSKSVDYEPKPTTANKRRRKRSVDEAVKTTPIRRSLRTRSHSLSSNKSDDLLSTPSKKGKKSLRKQCEPELEKIVE